MINIPSKPAMPHPIYIEKINYNSRQEDNYYDKLIESFRPTKN